MKPEKYFMKAKATILVLCAGLAMRQPAAAQNQKEMTAALQRDVAALQDEVRKMKGSQDEKLAALAESLRNTLDQVTRINEKMAAMQTTMNDKVSDMSKSVGAPIQGLSSKVDGVTDQFQNLSNTVAEMSVRIGKLDAKLEDVKKMIQAMPVATAPPTNPTPQQPQANNAGTGAGAVSGEKLYDDAQRDYLANNTDLALQGFTEYVKGFADTQRAPDAQFYIGEIYVTKQDWDNAAKAFDAVVNNYPDSGRVPMSHYRHATTLLHLGRRAEASKEFRLIIDKYPSTDAAKRSKEYLKTLGSPVSEAPAQKKTTARRPR
jgi:tol-pal system protein YbgF